MRQNIIFKKLFLFLVSCEFEWALCVNTVSAVSIIYIVYSTLYISLDVIKPYYWYKVNGQINVFRDLISVTMPSTLKIFPVCTSSNSALKRHRLLKTFARHLETTQLVIAQHKTDSKNFLLMMEYLKTNPDLDTRLLLMTKHWMATLTSNSFLSTACKKA